MTNDIDAIKTITISELERLKKQGYEVFRSGDASQANSDGFHILVRCREGKPPEYAILCPTFLRGPLRIGEGVLSY